MLFHVRHPARAVALERAQQRLFDVRACPWRLKRAVGGRQNAHRCRGRRNRFRRTAAFPIKRRARLQHVIGIACAVHLRHQGLSRGAVPTGGPLLAPLAALPAHSLEDLVTQGGGLGVRCRRTARVMVDDLRRVAQSAVELPEFEEGAGPPEARLKVTRVGAQSHVCVVDHHAPRSFHAERQNIGVASLDLAQQQQGAVRMQHAVEELDFPFARHVVGGDCVFTPRHVSFEAVSDKRPWLLCEPPKGPDRRCGRLPRIGPLALCVQVARCRLGGLHRLPHGRHWRRIANVLIQPRPCMPVGAPGRLQGHIDLAALVLVHFAFSEKPVCGLHKAFAGCEPHPNSVPGRLLQGALAFGAGLVGRVDDLKARVELKEFRPPPRRRAARRRRRRRR
mmetsp:Transcript_74598/g.207338  ORF Transcript_74598/g.207338 Transcript_74598/m.207338 type:complete len:392 (+) Transcript_74598:429-1604(+)